MVKKNNNMFVKYTFTVIIQHDIICNNELQ